MTHEQIKDYLLKYNIQSEEQLANHIEELKKNTVVNNELVFPLVEMLVNEKTTLNSFFREKWIEKIEKNIDDGNWDKVPLGYRSPRRCMIINYKPAKRENKTGELNPHIKYTILEQSTLTDKEQEQLSREHIKSHSTRHKATSSAFHLDEVLEEIAEKENKEQKVFDQLEDKTDKAFQEWLTSTSTTPILGGYARNEKLDPNYVEIKYPNFNLDGSFTYPISGVKESQSVQKAPIFTYCKVNKNALEQLAFRALYGHERYKDTDQDWQNFTRVPNGDFEYSNAQFRHALDIGEEDEETHLIASAWNAVARLEIFLREKDKKQ